MRSWLRTVGVLVLGSCALGLYGQGSEVPPAEGRTGAVIINPEQLWNGKTSVAGQGFEVPGITLSRGREQRHRIGDSAQYALRNYVDTAWASASATEDSVVAGATVHWVRYHLKAGKEVKGWPLLVNVHVNAAFTMYLNGKKLVQAAAPGDLAWARHDSVPRYTVPVALLCDGRDEVLALRLETTPGATLAQTGLEVSIHAADSGYHLNSIVMNYGLFIGINVLILLMALVQGWSEQKRKGWLLLAALSLCSVADTICVLGGSMGVLGWLPDTARVLEIMRLITVPWGMYLLIMVLAELRGELSRKRTWLYSAGIAVITVGGIMVLAMDGTADPGKWVSFSYTENSARQLAFYFLLGILALIGVFVVVWFAIEEVRLGIKLWRTKGYERWVGVGAVAASLLTFALGVLGGFAGFGLANWLSVLASYCSFVAVPISVAIYLSIRSAHHTRLVTRQRDELDHEVQERTAELRTERDRSDELLHNILPHEVAEELKHTGAAEAKHFDQATVLFTDFRGFTQMSEKLSPEQLVNELDTCFKHFDGLMDKWGMEKIKTIGDSYMAAGGLPDPAKGSPADVVHAALEMQEFMEELAQKRTAQGLPVFRMRVGIHTGPVVAGIVGVKKFQYDIWGDTVNTASRMESSGEVGQVNISGATYALVKDTVVSPQLSVVSCQGGTRTTDNQQLTTPAFNFTPRGRIQAKGKGEMEMYFVRRSSSGS
ncbi:MAG TPA: adenylate/guanylate cyclase domain-containing protein [Flavobacteriales bacterium]|nr:adenylate/guanylate cyclase domain-containing protein [Flavobacteriales bacterium]HRP82193.1 adenylate/guanylate cyclase domain-containing protein [Flavobacteriales bacterium]HRQ84124.1 adenylate/guanylate cyclase domain-containing protein [Flavobacteriales bacterium]